MRHIFVLAVFAALLSSAPAGAVGLKIGREVADVMLREAGTGRPVQLSDTFDKSKLTVLVFLSPRCRVSDAYLETLKDMARTWNERGVQFIGVASGVDLQEQLVAAHADKNGLPFPVLIDANMVVANMLGATVAPEVFVVNDERKLLYKGRVDDSRGRPKLAQQQDLTLAVESLLQFNAPPARTTRAHGCGIRRR